MKKEIYQYLYEVHNPDDSILLNTQRFTFFDLALKQAITWVKESLEETTIKLIAIDVNGNQVGRKRNVAFFMGKLISNTAGTAMKGISDA